MSNFVVAVEALMDTSQASQATIIKVHLGKSTPDMVSSRRSLKEIGHGAA